VREFSRTPSASHTRRRDKSETKRHKLLYVSRAYALIILPICCRCSNRYICTQLRIAASAHRKASRLGWRQCCDRLVPHPAHGAATMAPKDRGTGSSLLAATLPCNASGEGWAAINAAVRTRRGRPACSPASASCSGRRRTGAARCPWRGPLRGCGSARRRPCRPRCGTIC
jgi:hypothetical protein